MSLQRNRRADRVDRTVFTVTGLVVTGAGAAALAAGLGAFGGTTADRPVLTAGLQDTLDTNGWLVGLVAIVVLIAIAALAVSWLVFLLRPLPQTGELELADLTDGSGSGDPERRPDGEANADRTYRSDDAAATAERVRRGTHNGQIPGRVSLAPGALRDAVTRQLCSLPEVESANVRIPDRRPVEVHAELEVVDDTDLHDLVRAVLDEVRQPILAVTGLDDVRFLLEVVPTDHRSTRVA
jgi:hypothetical protein